MNDPDVEKFKRYFSWIQGIFIIVMAIFVILATYSYIGLRDCDSYCQITHQCKFGDYVKVKECTLSDLDKYKICNIPFPECVNFSNMDFLERDEWES